MCRERACEPPYTSNPVARTKRSGQTQVGLIRVFKVAPCLVNIIFFLFAARAGEASARGAKGIEISSIKIEISSIEISSIEK